MSYNSHFGFILYSKLGGIIMLNASLSNFPYRDMIALLKICGGVIRVVKCG